ncbi:LacI family DNA-binding transcriptional regulator [Arthrobacter sp. SD76]|uniref:LacI family DNA-binding transcriptional regulator n=1 Tax=Arthrobacter sp. SD76 TaxID=3415007 RepID=UPI003C771009
MTREKRVTITDIAERSGVSIAAVSFALNRRKGVSATTREKVLAVAEELGWAPTTAARSLAEARTETFGLILARAPETLGIESFYMRFLAGLEAELAKRSYGLLLQVAPNRQAELDTLIKWRNARRVDGVLVVDVGVDDPRIELLTRPGALPAVVVGHPSVAGGLTSVWTDDAMSMREMLRHLAALGHRRIARIAGLEHFAHTRIRDAAFREEARRLGVEPVLVHSDYTLASGTQATRDVLSTMEQTTALTYDNDVMAVAGLGVVMELGLRVPQDVSIVAWDDSVLCSHTYPPLTALSHDVIATGAHVARRLFDVLDGAAPAAFPDSTAALIARGSTGPARKD